MRVTRLGTFGIRHKIWLGFLIVLLILAAVSSLALIRFSEVKTGVGKVVKEHQPAALLSKDLETRVHQSVSALGFFLSTKEEIHKSGYLQKLDDAEKLLVELKQLPAVRLDSESVRLTGELEKGLSDFRVLGDRLIELAVSFEKMFPGIAYANSKLNPLSRQMAQLNYQMIASEEEEEADEMRKPLLMDIAELRYVWSNVMNGVRGYLAFRTDSTLADLDLYLNRSEELLDKLSGYGDDLTLDQSDSLAQIRTILAQYKDNVVALKEIHGGAKWRTDAWIVSSEVGPLFQAIETQLRSLVDRQVQAISRTSLELLDEAATTTRLVGMLMLIGLLVGAGLAWLSGRFITNSLRQVALAMHEIAQGEGDLTKRLQVASRDEIGLLSENFNTFIARIQDLVRHTARATSEVISAVVQTEESTNVISGKVLEQQAETEQVAAAVTEMAATISGVARNATSAEAAAEAARVEAEQGHAIVKQTALSIQSLSEDVSSTAEVIAQVGEASERIGSVLDVIKGVAEQTNLLALNAAIEAARAGDQGRGFAVVADEVRHLANRTQDSTIEIEQMIGQLQDGARDAVAAMEAGREKADANVQQANRARQSLEAITEAIGTINEMNTQIATASNQQSTVAEDINRCIVRISQGSKDAAHHSHETVHTTEYLGKLASQLQEAVQQFKLTGDDSFHFETAKSAHLAWKARLRGFLDGSHALSQQEAVSHRECVLGKWYYGEGLNKYNHIPEMKELEMPHQELHRIIKEIVSLQEAGQREKAEQVYLQVDPLSRQIINLLEKVEKKVREH